LEVKTTEVIKQNISIHRSSHCPATSNEHFSSIHTLRSRLPLLFVKESIKIMNNSSSEAFLANFHFRRGVSIS
jgi:hypothetical protein